MPGHAMSLFNSTMPLSGQHFHRRSQRCFQPFLSVKCAVGRKISHSVVSCDLVLSSGFMAFAYQAGFLRAVQQADLHIEGIMGTSSGALAGSLYAAGYSPEQVAYELCHVPPIQLLRPSLRPWRGGFFSLHKVVDRLRQLLPATFEELPKKFACAVVSQRGQHLLIDTGSLPEAVAASAAVPFFFTGVDIPGHLHGPFKDGGIADRVGLQVWRKRRRQNIAEAALPPCCVHLVSRSSPFSGSDDIRAAGETRYTVVRSPRSRQGFFSLGNYQRQMQASELNASHSLQHWREQQQLQQQRQLA